jgi:hypothetical protein
MPAGPAKKAIARLAAWAWSRLRVVGSTNSTPRWCRIRRSGPNDGRGRGVWADNETEVDLLGFEYLIDGLVVALTQPRLLPLGSVQHPG